MKYKQITDTTSLHDWQMSALGNPMDWQIVYWVLAKKRQKLTLKDPDWMPMHFLEMKTTWEEIIQHREAGTVPAIKEKAILVL